MSASVTWNMSISVTHVATNATIRYSPLEHDDLLQTRSSCTGLDALQVLLQAPKAVDVHVVDDQKYCLLKIQ